MKNTDKSTPAVLDLFCGVGGFSLGAARAGFKIAAAIDNDPIALGTHKKNFPSTSHINANLSAETKNTILSRLSFKKNDIVGIVGGPPCQGFSTMGANNKRDQRNNLFLHFFRLVSEFEPAFFVCENVPGLLREQFDSIRKEAFKYVKDEYDVLEPIIVNASDFGAPTIRKRVFFVGFKKNGTLKLAESDFKRTGRIHTTTVRTAFKGLPRKIESEQTTEENTWKKIRFEKNGRFTQRLHGLIPEGIGDKIAIKFLRAEGMVSGFVGTKHSFKVRARYRRLDSGEIDEVSRSQRLNPNGFCPTIRAGTGRDKGSYQSVRPIHPTQDRVITPREAARLQGFPDWFQFHSTKWHSFRQIGNSVSPLVAEILLRRIRRKIR